MKGRAARLGPPEDDGGGAWPGPFTPRETHYVSGTACGEDPGSVDPGRPIRLGFFQLAGQFRYPRPQRINLILELQYPLDALQRNTLV